MERSVPFYVGLPQFVIACAGEASKATAKIYRSFATSPCETFFCEVGVARAARFSTCPRFNGNELTNYVFKGCCSFVRGELRASATSTDRSLPQPKTKARRRSRQQHRRRAESGSNAACRPCSSSTIAASSAPTLRKTDNTTH